MNDDLVTKQLLRTDIRARREARRFEQRELEAQGFANQLARLTPSDRPTTVACYLSMPNEPGTRPYLTWARSAGVAVLVPVSRADGLMDWVEVRGQPEVEGLFGIFELSGDRRGPAAVADADLVIVPAAAVDRTGMRLGWGRGYFDRALATLQHRDHVYALIHDDELLDRVPSESHDLPVRGAVTPLRTVQLPEKPIPNP
ncbi:5-formyltetrahydrofolate cyclo-ligase [Naasia lichenicola]|uniref:5-formyltetrahydrofolate cyclo-ligase n=1 Tax=Naasia lichenicola TaxID=2565933 RepID=A0A4S4FIE3_9MICO|nr:5-formyltetrahydrofolate cyclo-ligase [Naasia lichenicola]THG30090.1 5-formyltetrahydrofolate cyclo-ligase [Naasia lichenicola]